ncbi:MAG: hypothetical protein R8J85_02730 [Mariprofundales bacterium]
MNGSSAGKNAVSASKGSADTRVDRSVNKSAVEKTVAKPMAPKIALRQRLFLPEETSITASNKGGETIYSFKAKGLPVTEALTMFARSYHLNMIVDPYAIVGTVTVEFHDVPFDQAMEAILHTSGYHWYRDGALIFVEAVETRQFVLNFLATKGDNRIWAGLKEKLQSLLSDSGKLVVSKLAGTIQVTDAHSHVDSVAQFLNQLRQTISRQVEIEMKIVEVTLNDDTSLGIDWNRINVGALNLKFAFSTANVITAPSGGFPLLSPSIKMNGGYTSNNGKGDINSVISALSEQGTVKIISQPRSRTLNNQPSLVKVGTDRTFITQETTTTSSTTTSTSVGYTKEVITEGMELNITPQISANGWVILDVKPKITRVSSVAEVKDAAGNVVSSGPNLDVRETSSLVRVHDGQTAVIGGLIQTVKSDTHRQVPLLGDLPLLGNLFKGSYDKDRRTELVIFLTPHLIGPSGLAN